MRPWRAIVLLDAALAALAGCDKKQGGGKTKPDAGPLERVDPAKTGVVEGVVTFEGTPPEPRTVEISEAVCKKVHGGPVKVADVAVKDGKLARSFVWVKAGLERYAFETPTKEIEIDQRGCMYEPMVVGAMIEQPVVFINSDEVNHNIHTLPQYNESFNFSMPNRGQRMTKKFGEAEVAIRTKCDLHPWMLSWIGVVPHPHYRVTSEDGAFRLEGVPAGELVVEAWHATLGRREEKVKLEPGATAKLTLAFRQ
jgi:plastocyanin